jgi:hypothetical protein
MTLDSGTAFADVHHISFFESRPVVHERLRYSSAKARVRHSGLDWVFSTDSAPTAVRYGRGFFLDDPIYEYAGGG